MSVHLLVCFVGSCFFFLFHFFVEASVCEFGLVKSFYKPVLYLNKSHSSCENFDVSGSMVLHLVVGVVFLDFFLAKP